jgi:hypothetical protein
MWTVGQRQIEWYKCTAIRRETRDTHRVGQSDRWTSIFTYGNRERTTEGQIDSDTVRQREATTYTHSAQLYKEIETEGQTDTNININIYMCV